MSNVQILHNPRCSKSRQTLQLLQENSIEPEVIDYLKKPLEEVELVDLKNKLGVSSYLEMMRPKEAEFKALGLNKESTEKELLTALLNTPKLLERPVVINGNKAMIGRPPENVLTIL
ncbi:MAG: arsenate reductase (glutaredoxin) [Aestuariibacter sp.]